MVIAAPTSAASDDTLPPEASEVSEAASERAAVSAAASAPGEEGAPNAWPDDAAESAMISELRERGDSAVSAPPGLAAAATAAAAAAARDADDGPVDPKSLPSIDELVQRIPLEVRETLEELFRAKYTRVTRVPKKALKS